MGKHVNQMGIKLNKSAFLCPGQASQKVGMCKDIYELNDFAKECLDSANDILGYDLKKIMFEGPEELLKQTIYTQPAMFTASFITGKLLINNGLSPSCAAGHSLGEFSAFSIADAFSFENGLGLVKIRAEAMFEAGKKQPGSMVAIIGLSESKIDEICSDYSKGIVCVANYNSASQVAVSGEINAIKDISPKFIAAGALKVIPLNVSGAFHSPLMKNAKPKLDEHLSTMNISDSAFPIYSNFTSKPVTDKLEIHHALLNQIENPVLWHRSVSRMINDGIKTAIEIGPGKVLQGLSKRIDRSLIMYGAESYEDILNLTNV